uniref:Uncharacterized protein n=1 Tax=Setaria digitata TaxID=48799 RepID=A0A915PUB1_9BILA
MPLRCRGVLCLYGVAEMLYRCLLRYNSLPVISQDFLKKTKMIPALFYSLYELIRFVFSFGAPTKERTSADEISLHLDVLQLDISSVEAVSNACVYLADPHKLPRPVRDADTFISREESYQDFGKISQHNLYYERTSEQQQQINEQCEMEDMSISSDSDFEETLRNHFENTPKPKFDEEVQKNGGSDFVYLLEQQRLNNINSLSVASTESCRSSANFSRKRNLDLRNSTGSLGANSSGGRNSEQRKRRISSGHFDENTPVQQFCRNSVVASTPLSTKPNNKHSRRLPVMNSAIRNKLRQSRQRTLLDLSVNSVDSAADSINSSTSKDEASRREQGAIVKHIARIRRSTSKLSYDKEAQLTCDSSRYYSMRTSFDSSDNISFNSPATLSP